MRSYLKQLVPDLSTSAASLFDLVPDGRGGHRKWEAQPLPSRAPHAPEAEALPPAAGQVRVSPNPNPNPDPNPNPNPDPNANPDQLHLLVPTAEVLALSHNMQLLVAQGRLMHSLSSPTRSLALALAVTSAVARTLPPSLTLTLTRTRTRTLTLTLALALTRTLT